MVSNILQTQQVMGPEQVPCKFTVNAINDMCLSSELYVYYMRFDGRTFFEFGANQSQDVSHGIALNSQGAIVLYLIAIGKINKRHFGGIWRHFRGNIGAFYWHMAAF